MDIITLPDDLHLSNTLDIQLFEYKSSRELSKQQILLNKNTISFLQEGTKEVYFDNSSFRIDQSQFLLMKSGHCLMTEKLSNTSNYYRSILLFFPSQKVLRFIEKYKIKIAKAPRTYSTFSFRYDVFVDRFVESLLDIQKFSKNIQSRILNAKFDEIMLYLIELEGEEFLYSLINQSSDPTQKFIQTIESNQLNKLTIKELSFLTNMSISTFKRMFKNLYQSTPSRWFQERRLEHAAHLLKNEKKRPSEIFEELGYENVSNFIQAFKSKYGLTPKQYQSY